MFKLTNRFENMVVVTTEIEARKGTWMTLIIRNGNLFDVAPYTSEGEARDGHARYCTMVQAFLPIMQAVENGQITDVDTAMAVADESLANVKMDRKMMH